MTMPPTGSSGGGDTGGRNSDGTKKKKTKLEKICELESALKIAKEENRRLKKELCKDSASVVSEDARSVRSGVSTSEDKLKDALRALKRVTVKQELSLTTLRSKAQQRRREIDQKDALIRRLSEDVQSLQKAYERMRGDESTDMGRLQSRVADLELKLAKEDTRNEEQTKRLAESKDSITSLKDQLDKVRGRIQKEPSTRSMRSTGSSMSAMEDIAKLKRELANKAETIVNLEFDLEAAKDEIHELKQRYAFSTSAFPMTPTETMDDDFFSEGEEDDEFWGN